MVLKNVCVAVTCTVLLACSGVAVADEYRPDQFLSLDLSKAVLSPKRLGPPAEFAPVPVEAKSDRGSQRTQASVEAVTPPKIQVAHVRIEKRHAVARGRLARRHSNPLDAEAWDARIHVWPCKSGGICSWKR